MYKRLCEYGDEDKALQIAAQKHAQCLREDKTIPSQMETLRKPMVKAKDLNVDNTDRYRFIIRLFNLNY